MPRRQLTPEGYAKLALDVASEAATLLLAGYRTRPAPNQKSRHDLVTEFDLKSEALIVERLSQATPELGIVAEERGGTPQPTSWYCDPLDGTTNYVHGHPVWSVSIGLLEEGQPVAGAVVAPALGLSWTGYRDGQALRNAEPCRVSLTAALDEALLATGFPPNREHAPENNLDTFVAVQKRARGVRRCGSAAIDMCMVADGTYDAYWERRLNAWDLAAGAAILLAAGGRISSLDGGPVNLHVGQIIASNGLVHDQLRASITP